MAGYVTLNKFINLYYDAYSKYSFSIHLRTHARVRSLFKDAMPVSFRSELFTSYNLTILMQ